MSGHRKQPLASLYAASVGDVQLFGSRPGQRTSKLVQAVRLMEGRTQALALVGGVNVHAKVVVNGRDRERLERLCRYVARPPLSQERLERHRDGHLRYSFKTPWKDGATAVLLDPLDFIGRLCSLIPAPRFHMLRYHGILAANACERADVVPGRTPSPGPPAQVPLFPASDASPPPARHPSSWLLRRVFDRRIDCSRRQAGDRAYPDHTSVPSAVRPGNRAGDEARALGRGSDLLPVGSGASRFASRPMDQLCAR